MKFIYTAILLVFSAFWSTMFAQIVEGQSCSAPISLECGLVYSNSTAAVPNDNISSGANVCVGVGSGGQIWYSYTADASGALSLSTCTAGGSFDTYIHVFTGVCGQLSCLAQNDDACSYQSILTIEVVQGVTYLIRVGGFASVSGAFNLSVTCGDSVTGCTDPYASNYNPYAVADDGSCEFGGCTDSTAANYNPYATIDDGSCIQWVSGCTNPTAVNYNPAANTDDGSCIIEGCTDSTAPNFNPYATVDNGSCQYCNGAGSTLANLYICTFSNGNQVELQIVDDQGNEVYYATGLNNGAIVNATICLQPGVCYTANMINNTGPFGWYNGYFWVNAGGTQIINAHPTSTQQFATVQFSIDGTCGPIVGCTDPAALNYNAEANVSDGSCLYPTVGCTDSTAVNFDPSAMVDDGSCVNLNDCLGNITAFSLTPGIFTNEASYSVIDAVGNVVASGTGATTEFACLLDGCYTVMMFDSFGDGWDGGGYLDVTVNGVLVNTFTLELGLSSGSAFFGINAEGCVPVIPGCTDVAALNYNPLANEDDGSCQYPLDCTENLLTIQVSTANWGSEMSWSIIGMDGVEYASGSGYSSWGWYTEYACVPDGCYELVMNDSWGDGWNGGYCMVSSANSYFEGSLYYGSTSTTILSINSTCGLIAGCMDAEAMNYNPQANFDDGSCMYNAGNGLGLTNGLEVEFALFPNPTNGGIIVNATSLDPLKVVTLNVYGAEGRLVRSANYSTGAASLQIEEDLTDVQAGYYFVELINGTSRIVKPLVKQ